MNIREMEQRLGIPRASIRYYEKEGLLHPARGVNNYREYTEEDLRILEKICLLRRLDMPIETIRAVQSGEVPLTGALARQEALLEGSAVRVEQSLALCRAMLADGATYPALEPARYEQPVLEPPAPPAQHGFSRPPVAGAEWAFSPWQRFWARNFDLALTGTAADLFLALCCHVSIVTGPSWLVQAISLVLGWALLLLLEPLLLSTWGTTPGKWLLGLELRSSQGRRLSFSQALCRTWKVLGQAYGYGIPIYNYYRYYKSYQTCRECEPMDYDWEEGNLYYSKRPDRWTGRAFAAAALTVPLSLATVWASYQSLLPPNRGAITTEQFYENVNTVADRLDYGIHLDGEGYQIVTERVTVVVGHGGGVFQYGDRLDDEPLYRLETDGDGFVSAVTVYQEEHFSEDEPPFIGLPVSAAEVMIWAFAGTEWSGYQTASSPLLQTLIRNESWSTITSDGFTLTMTLEQSGYDMDSSGAFLLPRRGTKECWYRCELRLERQ